MCILRERFRLRFAVERDRESYNVYKYCVIYRSLVLLRARAARRRRVVCTLCGVYSLVSVWRLCTTHVVSVLRCHWFFYIYRAIIQNTRGKKERDTAVCVCARVIRVACVGWNVRGQTLLSTCGGLCVWRGSWGAGHE